MKTLAAVLVELGQPLQLLQLEIPKLRSGQVLVEILFSGVCHTQLLEVRGYRGPDSFLPHCLGHEGSGLVQDVGPDVTRVKPGDFVVLSWIKARGLDVPSSVYSSSIGPVNAGAITTFSRHSVVSENRLTKIPAEIPADVAALLGCALPTGLGSVVRTASPSPGQSLAVFGVGGVGLAAVMGAHLTGCCPVVAIDKVPEKLELAKRLGATHCVRADLADPNQALSAIVPGGFDFAIEATGLPAVMEQALISVRPQGGIAVIVGNAHHGQLLSFDPKQLNQGKQLRGTWGGDTLPDVDIPRYARLLATGRLPGRDMISKVYPLEQVDLALKELESGGTTRPLINPSLGV